MRAPYYMKFISYKDHSSIRAKCNMGILILGHVLESEVGSDEWSTKRMLGLIESAKTTPFQNPIVYNGNFFHLELDREEVAFEFGHEEMAEELPGNSVPLEIFERAVAWWLRARRSHWHRVGVEALENPEDLLPETFVVDLNADEIIPGEEIPEREEW